MIAHSIFKLETQSELARKNGYLLIDAGIEEETEQLQRYIKDRFNISLPYFNYSLIENDYERNNIIRETIRKILSDFFQNHFVNYKTFNESFLIKPKNNNEELLLHQDFCYTNESNFASYNVWIPLTDVDDNNGAIFVLPGSHLWYKNYRSSSLPTARISMKNFLPHQIVKINMKRRQVLLFHPALFHGSFPNNTSENRIVVTTTITHKDADFLYYHQEKNDEVEVYRLDEDAYLRDLKTLSIKARPNAPLIEKFNYNHQEITENGLLTQANKMLK